MCRFSRRKISKDIVELNSTISQLDIIDIDRLIHPTTADFTFFSRSHETLIKIVGDATKHNKQDENKGFKISEMETVEARKLSKGGNRFSS